MNAPAEGYRMGGECDRFIYFFAVGLFFGFFGGGGFGCYVGVFFVFGVFCCCCLLVLFWIFLGLQMSLDLFIYCNRIILQI